MGKMMTKKQNTGSGIDNLIDHMLEDLCLKQQQMFLTIKLMLAVFLKMYAAIVGKPKPCEFHMSPLACK